MSVDLRSTSGTLHPYRAPVRDIRFVLDHVVDAHGLSSLPGFEHADVATMVELVQEFGRFCSEVLAPLNREGDRHGCIFDPATGTVTTPPGWTKAYAAYVSGGWNAVSLPAEHGGGGFPRLLGVALQEMLASSNMAFSLCPMLTQSAIELIGAHGTDSQRRKYLPPMASGEWSGTMNLTEPDAGSDLGAVVTRAVPGSDGCWRITGQKTFITYGEHDLVANIVHLVLARVPGAPSGTRGISCFIVPEFLDDGTRNNVRCVGIEHKMGIHGSPTCTMDYDSAVGELVGEPNAGMACMFTMMNAARLSVGLEGMALAERAYQAASAFASVRVQGRAPGAPRGSRSAIIEHPDVRRMLVQMRAHIEAMRALVYATAHAIDVSTHHPDSSAQVRARELADLFTPITKAWCTDLGSELTRVATQVHGGMGYITETGVEQHERDVRIAALYEGTNGIQAIDLVTRKLHRRAGGVVFDQIDAIEATAAGLEGELTGLGARLRDACAALRDASKWLLVNSVSDPADALAGATPYLRMFGTVLGGWFLARQALAAQGSPDPFLVAKVASARYYCEQLLPQAQALVPAVTAGADQLYALPTAALRP